MAPLTNIVAGTGVTANRVTDTAGESLWLRLVSGGVLAPAALVLVWLGGWYFHGLVIVAGLLMTREWLAMSDAGTFKAVFFQSIAVVVVGALAGLGEPGFALIFVFVGTLVPMFLTLAGKLPEIEVRYTAFGTVYILLPSVALIWLRGDSDEGRLIVIWMLLVVWASDIGAYFAGRAIGGPKMAPRLSPNKTWSGLGGGVLLAVLTSALVANFSGQAEALQLALFGGVLAVVGQIGDVFESSIKRRYNKKDSGVLIPGHGGVLDRLDSLLFVAPVIALFYLTNGGGLPWH